MSHHRLPASVSPWLRALGNRRPGELLVARSVLEMQSLRLALDVASLEAQGRPARVGFVPTMGALHAGHLSLCELARAPDGASGERADALVASIFVNPTQFAPHEDLSRYPRTMGADLAALSAAGADVVFAPSAASMYPPAWGPHRAFVEVAGVDATPEGAARPGFFRGVATVVAKLLGAVRPTVAAFGQKDGVQCIVIKQLVRDLGLAGGLRVVVGPTSRAADGLALSSRNVYLSPQQRAAAPAIFRALSGVVEALHTSPEGRAALASAAAAAAARRAAAGVAPGDDEGALAAAQRAAAAQQAASSQPAASPRSPLLPLEPQLEALLRAATTRMREEGGGHLAPPLELSGPGAEVGDVYLRLSDALTGAPIRSLAESTARGGAVLLSAAVRAGNTRLLDNVMLVGEVSDLGEPPGGSGVEGSAVLGEGSVWRPGT